MDKVTQKTVMVFVINNQKALLARRLNTWFGENQFAPPGGNIDPHETVTEAAIREVFEEVNLVISADDLRVFHSETNEANNRLFENYYLTTSVYSGSVANNEPTRHCDLDWYPLNDLPSDTMPLVIHLLNQL